MIASVPSGEMPQLVMRTRRVCSWTPEVPSMDGQCPTWTPGVGQCPMDALALAFRTGTFFRAQNSKVSWWKANCTWCGLGSGSGLGLGIGIGIGFGSVSKLGLGSG